MFHCVAICRQVIENMSGQGNTIGGTFAELRAIIDLVHDKSRVGICIDTCHAFAAGQNDFNFAVVQVVSS